ncbi:MAG: hypothetical protein ACYCZX_17210 [Rhodospirillaceae bacterium]
MQADPTDTAPAKRGFRLSNGTWAVLTFIAVFVFGWLVYRDGIPPTWLRDFAAEIALRATPDPNAPLPEDSRQVTPRGLADSPYICAANVIPLTWDKFVVVTNADEARAQADLTSAQWSGMWRSAQDLAAELEHDKRYQAIVLLKDGKVVGAELFFTFWADLRGIARVEGYGATDAIFVAAVKDGTYVLSNPDEIPPTACTRKAGP